MHTIVKVILMHDIVSIFPPPLPSPLTSVNMNSDTPATIKSTLKNFEQWYLLLPISMPKSRTGEDKWEFTTRTPTEQHTYCLYRYAS